MYSYYFIIIIFCKSSNLVNTIEFRVRQYGRYYFEIHPGVTETNDWMVGLVWNKEEVFIIILLLLLYIDMFISRM